MIKNSKYLLLLAVVAALISPPAVTAEPLSEVVAPNEITEPSDDIQQGFQTFEGTDNADVLKDASSSPRGEITLQPTDDPEKDRQDVPKDDAGYVHILIIIGLVFNFLLTAVFFVLCKNGINRVAERVAPKKNNKQKTITDLESELDKLKKQLNDQNADLNEIRLTVNDLAAVLKKLSAAPVNQISTSIQLPPVNQTATLSRPSTANQISTPRKPPPVNRNLQSIKAAYMEMKAALSKASILDGKRIKEEFANTYGVIAFKCGNSSARVNRPELPPVFEKSDRMGDKFWGMPASDGNLIVFPNPDLSDYENGMHNQGGFKELFLVQYPGGSYHKIEVKEPAVVTRDFGTILQKGQLLLER